MVVVAMLVQVIADAAESPSGFKFVHIGFDRAALSGDSRTKVETKMMSEDGGKVDKHEMMMTTLTDIHLLSHADYLVTQDEDDDEEPEDYESSGSHSGSATSS